MFLRILKKTFTSLCFISLISIALLIFFQDYLVFPQLKFQRFNPAPLSFYQTPPIGGEIFYLTAADGIKFQVASLSPPPDQGTPKHVVALFHGNGGTVQRFYSYMEALVKKGFTVYQLEYRGYGASEGWPTIDLLVSDAELMLQEISKREGVPISEIIPFGISFGTGIAAKLAADHQSTALGLVASYSSLKDAGRNRPVIGLFASFMHNDIDSLANISALKSSCVVAAHGVADPIINYGQSEALQTAYRGSSKFVLLLAPEADHNNIFWETEAKFLMALQDCVQ